MSDEKTFWNGMPTIATRGTAVVADDAQFPKYWAKEEGIVGTRSPVVCVILDSVNYGGGCTYMDNREGIGWFKVTKGHGMPQYPHASVAIVPGSFKDET